ncbi:DUF6443 domain-containing protein [Aquimarina algiphila]|uniref:DUF6443 domain-containing protein n=1 Tax=Aquimarina algiphila TaxID=2047982 RepID=UPI00249107E4|nr:DUF6443 domain-containing protein [Aquimarina algiphila]
MKKQIIYSIVMLLMGLQMQAQVVLSDKNYVHTTVPQTAVTIADMENVSCANANDVDNTIESVTYYDGLGRPIQQRAIKASPDGKDIVTHMQYDAYGRQAKQHLPFEANNTVGSYKTVDVNTDINAYYKNTYSDDFPGITTNLGDVNAYSESVFEASPLNRVTEQGAPGKAWKADPNSDTDHTIKFDWGTNASNEVVNFTVTFTGGDTEKPQLAQENHYAPNQLVVTITKDENWTAADGDLHTTKEYKDKQGRVILKRTYNNSSTSSGGGGAAGGGQAHDTYYVYDRYGNLTYVIPPKVNTTDGVSNTELAELCYQYKYDHRNRLIEKKIPGKGKEYIIYNTLDQPVLTQDANLRAKSRWLFTKYDAFGRVAYTGLIENGSTVALLRSRVSSSTYEIYETKTPSPITIAGTLVYYTKDAYPVSIYKVLTINYYDDYTFDIDGLTSPGTIYGKTIDTNTKSLPTGSKVCVLDTNDWITTVTYYDDKSRPIYVASKNHYLNTTDVIESKLDFVGKVEETKTTHTKGNNPAIVTVDQFTYDHMGRLLTQTQQINTQDTEQIVSNTYDALGQLKQKDVGSTSTPLSGSNGTLSVVEGLQTVDYTYNIRGWLKTINDGTTTNGDLFGFALEYNTATNPLYNGNIAATSWQTANDNVTRSYAYTYDALNRITNAVSSSGNYDLSGISYDKMGNILSLNRTGHLNEAATTFGVMDNLGYTYDAGNKLLKVTDTGNTTFGFKDGTNTNDDFTYDDNGNMVIDRNKGIAGITYNHLNLPKTVSISNSEGTGNITYIYDATGAKLKKIAPSGSSLTETEYAGNYIYKNDQLQYMSTPEGYATPEGTGYRYVYQYKDHLGNTRLSYTKNDAGTLEIIEENNYYPFGLTHKGYNNTVSSLGNSTAQKFKYNGIEHEEVLGLDLYEMDLRQYDPSIARWTGIDPVTHHSMSTYTAFDNNPIFWADPSGANSTREWMEENGITDDDVITIYQADDSEEENPQDDITVNSEGIVTNVVKNKKPNRFFDEDGNELSFNDSEGVDKPYITGTYTIGSRVFYSISTEQMNEEIINSGLIMQRYLSGTPFSGPGYWAWSWIKAYQKGHSDYDFSEGYLINLSDEKIPSDNGLLSWNRASWVDGTAFFRFGNTNNIYNLYDAGNYMWGRAMGMSGFSYSEIRFGSQANELFRDSAADQKAIKNGVNGN